MLTKKDKKQVVEKLVTDLSEAKSAIVADYKGMSANEMRDLKKKLIEAKVSFSVIKKNLVQIALDKLKIKANVKEYKGPVALAISSEDEIIPAKIIAAFCKENENLKFVSGVLDGKYLSDKEALELSKIPGKNELIAKAVGSIKAPINNFVGILGQMPSKLVMVLKAIEEKKA